MTTKKKVEKIESVLSPKATKLLLRVRDHILAEPKRLEMSDWITNPLEVYDAPACQTVACIAGWTTILSRPIKERNAIARFKKWDDWDALCKRRLDSATVREDAIKRLGLTDEQAGNLFAVPSWPKLYRDKFYLAQRGTFAQAGVVADRIMHFIETGE